MTNYAVFYPSVSYKTVNVDIEKEIVVFENKKWRKYMKDIWDLIKSSFSVNPRNVLTYGGRKYFYVYTDGNNVHLESGHNCPNGSNISTPRTLDKENLNAVFEEYKNGSKLSDVTKITFNSVYWFGIFKVLKL